MHYMPPKKYCPTKALENNVYQSVTSCKCKCEMNDDFIEFDFETLSLANQLRPIPTDLFQCREKL